MMKSYLKSNYPAAFVGVFLAVVSIICLHTADAQIGACYGIIGDNLPPPGEVIGLCKQFNIQKLRIYNPNQQILQALQGSNIALVVGVPNEEITGIAQDPNLARTWVQNNIVAYSNVNFKYIAVGNEISPLDWASGGIAPSVPQAMQNIYNALSDSGLAGRIKVSTVLSFGVLGSSYPPSAGAFKPEIVDSYLAPIVNFLKGTGGPFLINVYPYFTYLSDPDHISLPYALFTSPSPVVTDGPYQYYNLFDAMLDATFVALEKLGGGNVELVVTESGWPSDGGTATSVDNARAYNSGLIKSVQGGTPRRSGKPIETYIFDLIDENQKSPEYEKHWGLFTADKTPKYPFQPKRHH